MFGVSKFLGFLRYLSLLKVESFKYLIHIQGVLHCFVRPIYTDPKKKCPLHIYMTFLQTNAVFSFNYFASRNVIIWQHYEPKRTSFDAHLQQRQCCKHKYPNYESHIINISHVFHLHYSSQHIPVSLNGPVAALSWVPGAFLAVTTTSISLSRKCDITKYWSWP